MRIRQALLSATVSMVVTFSVAPPVKAQSFIQKLFGIGSSQPPASGVGPRRWSPLRRHYGRSQSQNIAPKPERRGGDDADVGPPDSGGPYRIMCVRACDGYYFPIRHHARHMNFAPDVISCRSACGDSAKLFYFPEDGGSPETMADLGGQKYADLPHAFGYRKKLVDGCTCKPAPWSGEEAARHEGYAIAEAAKKAADVSRIMTAEAEQAKAEAAPVPAVIEPPKTIVTPVDDAGTRPQIPAPEITQNAGSDIAEPKFEVPEPQTIAKAAQRRRTPRADRERVSGASFKPVYAPVWFKPSRVRINWRGNNR